MSNDKSILLWRYCALCCALVLLLLIGVSLNGKPFNGLRTAKRKPKFVDSVSDWSHFVAGTIVVADNSNISISTLAPSVSPTLQSTASPLTATTGASLTGPSKAQSPELTTAAPTIYPIEKSTATDSQPSVTQPMAALKPTESEALGSDMQVCNALKQWLETDCGNDANTLTADFTVDMNNGHFHSLKAVFHWLYPAVSDAYFATTVAHFRERIRNDSIEFEGDIDEVNAIHKLDTGHLLDSFAYFGYEKGEFACHRKDSRAVHIAKDYIWLPASCRLPFSARLAQTGFPLIPKNWRVAIVGNSYNGQLADSLWSRAIARKEAHPRDFQKNSLNHKGYSYNHSTGTRQYALVNTIWECLPFEEMMHNVVGMLGADDVNEIDMLVINEGNGILKTGKKVTKEQCKIHKAATGLLRKIDVKAVQRWLKRKQFPGLLLVTNNQYGPSSENKTFPFDFGRALNRSITCHSGHNAVPCPSAFGHQCMPGHVDWATEALVTDAWLHYCKTKAPRLMQSIARQSPKPSTTLPVASTTELSEIKNTAIATELTEIKNTAIATELTEIKKTGSNGKAVIADTTVCDSLKSWLKADCSNDPNALTEHFTVDMFQGSFHSLTEFFRHLYPFVSDATFDTAVAKRRNERSLKNATDEFDGEIDVVNAIHDLDTGHFLDTFAYFGKNFGHFNCEAKDSRAVHIAKDYIWLPASCRLPFSARLKEGGYSLIPRNWKVVIAGNSYNGQLSQSLFERAVVYGDAEKEDQHYGGGNDITKQYHRSPHRYSGVKQFSLVNSGILCLPVEELLQSLVNNSESKDVSEIDMIVINEGNKMGWGGFKVALRMCHAHRELNPGMENKVNTTKFVEVLKEKKYKGLAVVSAHRYGPIPGKFTLHFGYALNSSINCGATPGRRRIPCPHDAGHQCIPGHPDWATEALITDAYLHFCRKNVANWPN